MLSEEVRFAVLDMIQGIWRSYIDRHDYEENQHGRQAVCMFGEMS